MNVQKALETTYSIFDLNDDLYDSVEEVRKGVIKSVSIKIASYDTDENHHVKDSIDFFDYTIKGKNCTATGKVDGRSGVANYLYFRKQSEKLQYLRDLVDKAGIDDDLIKENIALGLKNAVEREEEEQAEFLARCGVTE